ncbi:MAG: Rrf2 family transcriptional regulator [Alphaproteobacteria bacterium]
MKLSTKGQYAVLALVDLAKHGDHGPVNLSDIAIRQDISQTYLEQLFGKLRRNGVVSSVRGPGGGYLLARPADELCIADVIRAVDEAIQTTRCDSDSAIGCTGSSTRCLTHDLWDELARQINVFLASITLADVVDRNVIGKAGLMTDAPFAERAL